MLKIGLTGNIGSGKSTVASIFEVLGIPVYKADEESRKFLDSEPVQSRITDTFGTTILTPTGTIDRKRLAQLVFSDPDALSRLNLILHPLVIKDFGEWTSNRNQSPYLILEAAIIFEGGYKNLFDKIIHVSCPPAISIERVMKRDRITFEEVNKRLQFQIEDEKKAVMSDFIIRNDGSEMVIPQVLIIHRELLKTGS